METTYRSRAVAYAFCAVLFLLSAKSTALVIDFDDIETNGAYAFLPEGYMSLSWGGLNDWFVVSDSYYSAEYGNTYGSPSGDNAVSNSYGAQSISLSDNSSFTFTGASFAGWGISDSVDPLGQSATSITVTGYNQGEVVGSQTLQLSSSGYQWLQADLQGVDELRFVSSGDGEWWLMDDLTLNESSYTRTISGEIVEEYNFPFTYQAIFDPTADRITVKLDVHLDWQWESFQTPDPDTETLWEAVWEQGIENAWSNQFKVVDGANEYPIYVDVEWVAEDDAFFTVGAHPIDADPDADRWPDARNFYTGVIYDDEALAELKERFDIEPSSFEIQQYVAAHEAGHWLGNADEYAFRGVDGFFGNHLEPAFWPLYLNDGTCFSLLRAGLYDPATCIMHSSVSIDSLTRSSWAQWLLDATYEGALGVDWSVLNVFGDVRDKWELVDAILARYPNWDISSLMNGMTKAADIEARYFSDLDEWLLGVIKPVSGRLLYFPTDSYRTINGVPGFVDPLPMASSVPEPGTLALFGLGLAGLGAVRRKKLAA